MKYLLVFIFTLSCQLIFPQNNITPQDFTQLKLYEDTLRTLGDSLVRSEQEVVRQKSCYDFIRKLVKALQISGSFNYEFSSLCQKDSSQKISIIYPEDKSFRIFNWTLSKDNGTYRYFGAIQMNSKKPLKSGENFFPLFDYSDFIKKEIVTDTILTDSSWYGCIYYNLLTKKYKKKKYYFLFGWDGNNLMTSRKLIDVLYFENGKPKFGAPVFETWKDTVTKEKKLQTRFLFEYKKSAWVNLNYNQKPSDAEKTSEDIFDKIIFDHLVSQTGNEKLKYTLIPDGTYEGFEYKKGKWIYIPKIFNFTLQDGQAPRPVPKLNEEGIK